MLAFAFTSKARVLQEWARRTYGLLALVTIAWSIVGFLRMFQTPHWGEPMNRTVESVETLAVGIGIGLFVSLVLSGQLGRMLRSPSSPQPPAT